MTNLSFTDMGGSTVFVDLLNNIRYNIRHLEPSTADDFNGETGIIASILGDASTRLPQLRSVKVFMNGQSRVRTLQKLLWASVAVASANIDPVSFVFWTYDHMIRGEDTGDIDFAQRASSRGCDGDDTPVTPTDMVSILRNELLSVKIVVSPYPMIYRRNKDEDADADLDFTENVIRALGDLAQGS